MSSSTKIAPDPKIIQKRLSESMREVQKREEEVQGILNMMDRLPSIDEHLMMRSASSSRKKRDKTGIVQGGGYREELQKQVAQKRQELGLLWVRINELQTKERGTEKRRA
ncbi:hypothetical protein J3F83DRAFT_749629 [Trichoderma novae-zelandiae]